MVAATSRTYSCTSSAACLAQLSMNGGTRRSRPPRGSRHSQLRIPQALDLVAQRRGFLEIEVGGGAFHLDLQVRDVSVQLLLVVEALGAVDGGRRRQIIALVHARHDLVDRLDDRLRRDAVLDVVSRL